MLTFPLINSKFFLPLLVLHCNLLRFFLLSYTHLGVISHTHDTDQCTMWIESKHTYQHKQITSILLLHNPGKPCIGFHVSNLNLSRRNRGAHALFQLSTHMWQSMLKQRNTIWFPFDLCVPQFSREPNVCFVIPK
jgi:hypothetical protein